MEPISLDYSTKNITLPDDNTYWQDLIRRGEKFVHGIRWKANFYLHPEKKPQKKQNFGFKTTNKAPPIKQLVEFVCHLCTKEKFYVLLKPELSQLNNRTA